MISPVVGKLVCWVTIIVPLCLSTCCPSPWAVVTIPRGVAAVAAACAMAVVDGRLCLYLPLSLQPVT